MQTMGATVLRTFKSMIQITWIYRCLNRWRWRERVVHYGNEHSDQTFYVIRRHASRAGLFSFAMTNLASVVEAVEHDYIPVIDMQNSINPMISAEEVGKVNGWELFYEQPCGYSLEDIQNARNVILGSINPPENYPEYEMLEHPEEILKWREQYHKYIHVRPEIREAADRYICEALQNKRTLGVLYRGTDYVMTKPHDHPIQPKVSAVIARCRKVMQEYHCDQIYLCTEDADALHQMEMAFPGQLRYYQQHHYSLAVGENINDVGNAHQTPYARNAEYLTSIEILARCNCLVAGAAGGTYGALLMTDGYDYEYVYQLGRYGTQEPGLGTQEYEDAAL